MGLWKVKHILRYQSLVKFTIIFHAPFCIKELLHLCSYPAVLNQTACVLDKDATARGTIIDHIKLPIFAKHYDPFPNDGLLSICLSVLLLIYYIKDPLS